MTERKSSLDDLRIDRSSIVEERSRSLLWLTLFGALIIAAALVWWMTRARGAEVVTAIAQEVRMGEGQTVLNASGYVTARRQATVSSKVTARVLEVLIEEGMAVKEGQVLARLDTTNVDASLGLARAELAAVKTALEETKVQLAEANLNLNRTNALVKDEVVSQAELDRVQASVDVIEARL